MRRGHGLLTYRVDELVLLSSVQCSRAENEGLDQKTKAWIRTPKHSLRTHCDIVMACMIVTCVVKAYIVKTYIVMAYIVMAGIKSKAQLLS